MQGNTFRKYSEGITSHQYNDDPILDYVLEECYVNTITFDLAGARCDPTQGHRVANRSITLDHHAFALSTPPRSLSIITPKISANDSFIAPDSF